MLGDRGAPTYLPCGQTPLVRWGPAPSCHDMSCATGAARLRALLQARAGMQNLEASWWRLFSSQTGISAGSRQAAAQPHVELEPNPPACTPHWVLEPDGCCLISHGFPQGAAQRRSAWPVVHSQLVMARRAKHPLQVPRAGWHSCGFHPGWAQSGEQAACEALGELQATLDVWGGPQGKGWAPAFGECKGQGLRREGRTDSSVCSVQADCSCWPAELERERCLGHAALSVVALARPWSGFAHLGLAQPCLTRDRFIWAGG